MPDYRKLFDPLIKNVEGHKEDVYSDTKGKATVGTGLNLDDGTIQGLMKVRGIEPAEVKSGTRRLASDELSDIHNSYLNDRERLVKDRLTPELFDGLKPNEKAAIMSMGYQSLNNLGPNLTGAIASGDKIAAIREMILNTNKDQDPGILSRRLQEAEMYGGPLDFSSAFKVMSPEEKKKILEILEKTQNEHTRQELSAKYRPYLDSVQKSEFLKLNKLLNSKIAGTDNGQK